jgi:hypothetical protein
LFLNDLTSACAENPLGASGLGSPIAIASISPAELCAQKCFGPANIVAVTDPVICALNPFATKAVVTPPTIWEKAASSAVADVLVKAMTTLLPVIASAGDVKVFAGDSTQRSATSRVDVSIVRIPMIQSATSVNAAIVSFL